MTRTKYCPCVWLKRFLGKFCKEAREDCVLCLLVAGLCIGTESAFAQETVPCNPRQDIVETIKSPMTWVGDGIATVFGIKLPCPQGVMMKIADAGDRSVAMRLSGNPYANGRITRIHRYR